MNASRARDLVREAGGDALVERLLHLDRDRGRAPDGPPLRGPDAGAHADFDVLLAGGGLSILYAPILAALGLRVAVVDRARAGAAHREWNASRRELAPLIEAGLFSERELEEDLIVARYTSGVCRWHEGGAYAVRGVLDHAVDAGRLLERARQRTVSTPSSSTGRASSRTHRAARPCRWRFGPETAPYERRPRTCSSTHAVPRARTRRQTSSARRSAAS